MPFFTNKYLLFRIIYMNKKYISLFVLPLLLSGCSSGIKLQFVEYKSFEGEDLMVEDHSNPLFNREKETTPVTHKYGTANSLSDMLEDFKSGHSRESIPTTGDRQLLVVPISFTDSDRSNQDKKTIFLQNAFFGANDHTNYYSVAGYYNASSYGQLRIDGEVAPWYNSEQSSTQASTISGSYMDASSILVAKAIDYLREINFDLSKYDTDDDGNIDGVYAIYDHPFSKGQEKNNLFWAYTHYTYSGEHSLNTEAPYLNGYSWTSIDTILQKDNRSYTNYLIHETGHLLGLTDYYNTKYSEGDDDYHFQPTGCFDMMDYNIGDHSSFSKYLFKWTSPMVVKPNVEGSVKLKPFTTSGEYILVPSAKYNNSPFSEYLLIEYFAPTGLNKFSGAYSYTDANGKSGVYKYPQWYGLRIYHVNATLGYYKTHLNSQCVCTIDDPNWESKIATDTVGLDFAYSNTIKDSDVGRVPVLVHLLESSGKNTFKDYVPANNYTLFRTGDDFGITKFTDFTFSDGSKPNFKLKVKSLSTKDITIEISTKQWVMIHLDTLKIFLYFLLFFSCATLSI